MVECSARAARSRVCASILAVAFCAIDNDRRFLFCFSLLSIGEAAALFEIFTVFKLKKISKKNKENIREQQRRRAADW